MWGMVALVGWSAAAGRADAAPAEGYEHRPEARGFASELASRHGWPAEWVLQQLKQARLQPTAQRLMMPAPSGQPKNWAAYRERFVEPKRILAGVAFWQANEATLARAEARFGVPADIIVGIIGVETYYGRVLGNFRALDVLATLAFDFPTGRSDRSDYFRSELEALLMLSRQEQVAPSTWRGSYAGAIGLPQFMPASINRHALDFDGDGHIELTTSAADAIGSVAQFLSVHGWQRGMPLTYAVTPPADPAALARLLAPDILPSFDAAALASAGAGLPDSAAAHGGPMALVMVENGEDEPSYVLGTENFYALTRYNRSSYYARAVIDLGAAVQRSR
jgi:membrane-bound lytic murein transglycosylase B